MKPKTAFRAIWTFPFLALIRIYQSILSPFLGPACRFTPTCSEYMFQAIKIHGLKGLLMGLKRVGRCHPWGGQGYDPVKPKTPDSVI